MEERIKFNFDYLNPKLKSTLEKLLDDISSSIPEEKTAELRRIINDQNEYTSELIEKLRKIGLFINDTQNGNVYPNQYWYDWGYTEKDMIGNGFLKFVYPEDLQKIKNLSVLNDSVQQEASSVVFRFRTKKGDWRWIHSSTVSVSRDEYGKVKQYIGFDIDITEEKEAKEKLKRALEETKAAKERAEANALEANTLREISTIISSSLDLRTTIKAILDQAKRLIPYDTATIQILENNRMKIIEGRGWKDLNRVIGYSLPIPGDNPNTVIAETKKPLIIGKVPGRYNSFSVMTEEYDGKSWMGIPLIFREKVMGILTFDKKKEDFFNSKHANLGTVFASHVAVALHNSSIFEKTKAIAMTDPLTGVKNRRAFINFAVHEDKLFKRYGTVFSLIMIDIDFFKKINDRFGHQTGDEVLKDLVALINNDLRDSDIICRYGGEEFAILLPSSDEEAAYDIGERIRKNVEANLKAGKTGTKITISVGCADRRGKNIDGIDSLISMADKALYHAKESGRNCSKRYSQISSYG